MFSAACSERQCGGATRWSAAGGRDAPIAVFARGEQSGTTDVLKALVLGGKPIVASATRYESNEKLSDAVAADVNGFGYVGLAAVRSSKALMIEDKGALPLLPSPATLAAEDYLLTRRLYLYTPSKPSKAAQGRTETGPRPSAASASRERGAGSRTTKRAPPRRALAAASIVPPCSTTTFFTMASPRPVPSSFVVK